MTITQKQIAELNAALDARGIGASTRQAFGIESCVYLDRLAWQYPTHSRMSNATRQRIKFADGGKPKYHWGKIPKFTTNDDWRLFLPLGITALREAVAASKGKLFLPCGEPDFFTLHAASGKFPPATCPLGEGNAPKWFPEFCLELGVKEIVHYPDIDDAGLAAAQTLYAMFADSPVRYAAYRLPDGCGKDINDFWIACEFGAHAFWTALKECPVVEYTQTTIETQPRANLTPKTAIVDSGESDAIKAQVNFIDFAKANGLPLERKGNAWQCCCPFHPDKTPSFTAYADGWKCFGACNEGGDIYSFVMKRQNVDFPTALQVVADYAGIPIAPRVASNGKHVNLDAAPQSNGNGTRLQVAQAATPTVNGKPKLAAAFLSTGEIAQRGKRIRSVRIPLQTLRAWGGFFSLCPTGLQMLIVGGTGVAKTILGETMCEAWAEEGVSSLWYSPEWTESLFLARRIQRYTWASNAPVTVENQIAHDQWEYEQENGLMDNCYGVRLSGAQMAMKNATIAKLSTPRYGDIYSFSRDHVNHKSSAFLPQLMDMIADTVSDKRKAGKRLDVVFIDYVQMLNDHSNRARPYEVIMESLKDHAIQHDYLMVLTSQATKNSAKNSKQNGGTLDLADAQEVRGDSSNVALTITPLYEDTDFGRVQQRDEHGNGLVQIVGAKNSMGAGGGKVHMAVNYRGLYYEDKALSLDIAPHNIADVPF